MSQSFILESLQDFKKSGQKKFVVLIDPDKVTTKQLEYLSELGLTSKVDYFFIGGSLLVHNQLDNCIEVLKRLSDIPLILFPGNTFQINKKADAILFLSLISGRNPELLIGNHVIAAPYIKASGLEVLPTGYILIDGGKPTSVSYMSNTNPIPSGKNDIALCTAMAGEMLGLQLIYLDAGSGAKNPVQASMIQKIAQSIEIPLIVGGGIRTAEQAFKSAEAGADIIIVGNALEKEPELMIEMSDAVHSLNKVIA